MTPPAAQDITAMLRAENLEVEAIESENLWYAAFDIEGQKQTVVMILPPDFDYYVIFAPHNAEATTLLDKLPATTLRALIREASTVLLAKLEYLDDEDGGWFAASSECSIVSVDGSKLHRRMEACARLGAKIRAILDTGSPPS